MGRDRLAALRAQRQGEGAIELQNVQAPLPVHGATDTQNDISTMSGFYSETTAIQELIAQFDTSITAISDLHSRSLNALSDQESAANASRLAELTESTRTLSNSLSQRIKALQTPVRGLSRNDVEIRKNRITLVHGKFVEALQRYQMVEQQYRQRHKDRVERQFKIVKPDASPEEVSAVVNNTEGNGDGIFLQAISTSNRYGDSRQAYREVQERHQDIQRIEHTLGEIAQLFNDMANLINQQQDQFDDLEAKAETVELETGKGKDQVGVSVKLARSLRRKRWICFWITVVIILVAVGVGLGVYFSQNSSNSSSNSGSTTTVTATATAAATPSTTASAGTG